MPVPTLDTPEFTSALESAIGELDLLYESVPPELRLRSPVCGIASTAIHYLLEEQGHEAYLFISEPNFSFDNQMQHVFNVVNTENKSTVIDSTFSQFLSYTGLSRAYTQFSNKNEYPSEKIISFEMSDRQIVADWLATVAVGFKRRNQYPSATLDGISHFDMTFGYGSLDKASQAQIAGAYAKLWDPQNIRPYSPAKVVRDVAEAIHQKLPIQS